MDDSVNTAVLHKLDLLIKIGAANLVAGKNFKEQVKILSSLGFQPKDISELIGKTANNVRVMLNNIRHGRSPKK
jgi:hypothetical protein